jgi:hypothetical protein
MTHPHHCPACRREFKHILEYPRVRVLGCERLPIPEAVDYWSTAAIEKKMARRRAEQQDFAAPGAGGEEWLRRKEGINMTPVIAEIVNRPEIEDYLARLAALVGQEVAPQGLLPPLAPHGYFKWAYPIAKTGVYLSLSESEQAVSDARAAEVQLHCDGPNLGSAGGPTLQPLGAIARLRYQGLLAAGFAG